MAKKSSSIYIVAISLFVLGIGYMVWSGVSQNSMYFLNVSEALAMEKGEINSARLFGNVAANNIVRPQNGVGVDFHLVDIAKPDEYIQVSYKGVVPETFEAGSEVIIEGQMKGDVFHAKTLMTKCPSKYEKENREKNA